MIGTGSSPSIGMRRSARISVLPHAQPVVEAREVGAS